MTDTYRRLAVLIDRPSEGHFLWMIIESVEDPSVWQDLETSDGTYDTWIEAFEAGNEALMAHVDDEAVGPVHGGEFDDSTSDDD